MLMLGALAGVPPGYGQDNAQYPPSIRWRQIKTEHFRLIFDKRLEEDARRTGGVLEYIYNPSATTLQPGTRRLPVLLGSGSTANGFVSLTPRRSEWGSRPFFPGSRPGIGTGEWYELLAVHEYRHVVQIHTMNRGFSRLMRLAFGHAGLSVSTNAAVPGWFWEGDAVNQETAFTLAGRGRMPSFALHVRALLSEGTQYSYQKALFRTYRDYYPNEYVLGYLLTAYVKKTYGPEAWEHIIERANDLAFVPLSFNLAVKRETGRSMRRLYDDAMTDFAVGWAADRTTIEETKSTYVLDAADARWTNYAHPQFLDDGSIVAVESGSRRTGTLVRIMSDGQTRRLGMADPALYFSGFSAAANTIVWHQARRHPRWGKLEFSVIMMRDLRTGRESQVTHRSFLFVPSLSPDGQRIAAVEYNRDRLCTLVLLDRRGKELQRIPSPGNEFISSVAWMDDGRTVVVNRQDARAGKAISLVDLSSGEFVDVVEHSFADAWRLSTHGQYVLYNTPESGIDQIYAVDTKTGSRYRAVTRRLGAYYPSVSPDGKRLVFSDYSAAGLSVAVTAFDPTDWIPVTQRSEPEDETIRTVREQETAAGDFDLGAAVPVGTADVRYNRIADLLKFYSWTPAADDDALLLALDSRNLLNTFGLRVGALFDRHSRTLLGFSEGRYSGAFPTFLSRVQYGGRTEDIATADGETSRVSWNESSVSGSMAIPLVFDRGRTTRAATVEVGLAGTDIWDQEFSPRFDNGNGQFIRMRYAAYFSSQRVLALNDIVPRWQTSLFGLFEHTPFASDFRGRQLYASVLQSLPGLSPQHVLRLSVEAEVQEPDNYRFDRIISVARGYDVYFLNERYRASASYIFPVAYPDFSIGNLFYTNRFFAVAFADYDHGEDSINSLTRSSAGIELLADIRLFSIPLPIRAGVRGSYRFADNAYRVEPIISF